jgi:hypothetical protein
MLNPLVCLFMNNCILCIGNDGWPKFILTFTCTYSPWQPTWQLIVCKGWTWSEYVEGSGCSYGSSVLLLHWKVSHIGGRVEEKTTAQKEGWHYLTFMTQQERPLCKLLFLHLVLEITDIFFLPVGSICWGIWRHVQEFLILPLGLKMASTTAFCY